MATLQKENRWVETPVPRVMRKNIKKLKKFPWMTKAILIRAYRDDETDRKLFKFVFSDDYRDDFIRFFNELYQKEWDKYQTNWIKFIWKAIESERERAKKDGIKQINETTK